MKLITLGLAAALTMSSAAAASAATYSFHMDVATVSIDGFFSVDSSSPNYVGGGTTTSADLLDYALTFTQGSDSFVGTPANTLFIQTFDITYSPDLSFVTGWDISIHFLDSTIDAGFVGNNVSGGGFAQVTDFRGPFGAFVLPAPTLTAELVTPIPAALPLFATGLGAIGLLGWRRRKRPVAAAA